jgi:hypothetical protein
MADKLKQVLPLSLAFSVLAFAWIELSLNYTFHWGSNGDLGNGLGLPANLHLVAPAAFISWGLVFAAGANAAATFKVALASVIGAGAALVLMVLAPATAELPDFWGIALWVGVLGFVAVALSVFEWYYAPAALAAFASVVFWWLATGLDGWAEKGGGVGSGLESLADPATAGAGAFGGVLSTPSPWVWASVSVSLLAGCVLAHLTITLAGLIGAKATSSPELERV